MPDLQVEKLGADIWNTTYYPKAEDHLVTEKSWYLIDAKGQRLGRMAVLIAQYLRGANKATYTPSQDMGSYVVVINAEQVEVTGRKREQKMYVRHTTGRPGGHVVESFQALQKRIPTRIVEEAGAFALLKRRGFAPCLTLVPARFSVGNDPQGAPGTPPLHALEVLQGSGAPALRAAAHRHHVDDRRALNLRRRWRCRFCCFIELIWSL